ncbi:hypothetical protein evm_011979 [Chilo suppressalis]|nr:hypothetical protein evm_011979 [Chilo suppressalis]
MWRFELFILLNALCYVTCSYIIVDTPVGSVSGVKASDGDYYAFFGIPYGVVNRSNLFGVAERHPKFDEVFEAVDDSIFCPQILNQIPQGSIDCLQLNIFVPTKANNIHRLPVMVHIHGGSFFGGSKSTNTYGPKYLVRHDVILVVINYRLGPYGFMCLDIPEVPGNQGLKDQVLALRWIRENIESFGGDITKITVFGVSAGGHSIEFHLLSVNENLFSNAIIQSGSAEAATVFTDHDKVAPLRIAEELSYNANSLTDAINYLSTLEPNLVIQASNDLSITYKPCTEQIFEDVSPFLTRYWVNANIQKVKDMPIIIGFCEHELLMANINSLSSDFSIIIMNRLLNKFNFNDERLNESVSDIQDFYLGNENLKPASIPIAAFFDSDFTYIYPIQRSIKKFIQGKSKSVYQYMFSYNGGRNSAKFAGNVTVGSAVHSDEYVFDVNYLAEKQSPEDLLILDRVTTMWTNFAKYGDPSPEITDLLTTEWLPISNESEYFHIDSTLKMEERPLRDRMDFWDDFYIKNYMFLKGYNEE